jgi:phosphoglycolate phosphatase
VFHKIGSLPEENPLQSGIEELAKIRRRTTFPTCGSCPDRKKRKISMSTRNVEAVMFDFDLTLADSSKGIVECTQHALREMKMREADALSIESVIGLPLRDMFFKLTGTLEPSSVERFSRLFIARADQVMVPMTRIYPEVPILLAHLSEQRIRTAVVSTKFRYRIEAILTANNLRSSVDLVIGGEDVQRHKPYPDAITLALSTLSIPANDAIYVGDHPVDADAARAANVRFIGVLTGSMSRERWSSRGECSVHKNIIELADPKMLSASLF